MGSYEEPLAAMISGKESLDDIDVVATLAWIQNDDNVSAEHRKSVEFIRFLSDLFLTRALKTTLASTADKLTDEEKKAETQAVEKLAKLMEPFVSDDEKLETEVLFVLQKLCEKTGHKRGMFQRVIQQLYQNEWLSEEAILAWNEDTSPQHEAGKMKCLMNATKFLQWLKEHQEEEEGEEEEGE